MIISGHAAPAVLLHIFRLFMLMQIFLSRSHPAPNMPLRLIHVQYLPRFPGKGWVNLEEPLGDIWWCQDRNKKIRFIFLYKFEIKQIAIKLNKDFSHNSIPLSLINS